MKKIKPIAADLVIFGTHLVLLWIVEREPVPQLVTVGFLLAVLICFFISAWSVTLFESAHSRAGKALRAVLPCLAQLFLIGTADVLIYRLWVHTPSALMWLVFCIAILIGNALLLMAVGAARTMLYHDEERRNRHDKC